MSTTKTKLAAALLAPEQDVKVESRKRSSSFAAQVRDLNVGETASRVKPMPRSISLDKLMPQMPAYHTTMRNNCVSAVNSAKATVESDSLDGADYKTEVCDFLSPAGTLFVLALVTRVA